ncbi:uncharacterized protein PgNI_02965 [Pyricularia grisea]|uniref:Probable beta-glucosidase btgE n=1 Tax=Pyricularia grisea TaxID=148305 RepID=A0A6P8B9L5_PYRGI|nr:uncharacterized protein PgNI_02965 [Pyricularia grisea]TLD12538.1 hypothetical protein PgNI_02965 [Pyricularia grisea]
MKGFTVATAAVAALSGGVSAHRQHRQAHYDLFAKRASNDSAVCVPECKTYYTTFYGEPTLVPDAPKPSPTPKTTAPATVPTPIAQECPTPGTYTFPATTMVVTETVTACAPSSTVLTPGTNTIGGVTTVVTTATTVVCPVPTVKTETNGDVTSIVTQTTFVCPSSGTYVIGGTTTAVSSETTVVVPTITSFPPGTYTAPAVTTIVDTKTVVYCPFSTDTPAPAPTVAPTSAAAPPPAQPTTSKASETPSTPVSSTPATSPSASSPPTLGGGNQWAMTYTPYGNGGVCKSADEVESDIAKIKAGGFKSVRVYSTDCNTLPNVGAACRKHGVKMIIGVFVGQPGCTNGSPQVAEQISAIKSWAQWDLVEMCVVGNEALFNGHCTPSQLKDLIGEVRGVLRSGGCNAPVTTTDTVGGWEGQGVAETICPVVDVVSANIHAYFNGAVLPQDAGKFVSSQLQHVQNLCGGKEGYVMETGWPTGGKCIGISCPGEQQQAEAIKSIQQECGGKSVFFSWTDDDWKASGDCGCENHFGCGRLFSS